MKYLTTAIYGKLSGSTFSTAIGGRLFKGQAPDGVEYPYSVYTVVTDVPVRTFSEIYEDVLIQFSIFSIASGTTEIEDAYSNLKTLYDEKSLTITGSTLVWMRRSNTIFSVEDHITPTGSQRVWAYHVDFEVLTSLD